MAYENDSADSMRLTPLVIRKMRFPSKMRGYDPREVEEFLALVAEELTRALGESDRRRQETDHLKRVLGQAERRERELQETLTRAQKVSDEILATAQREAQLLVQEAEATGNRIVEGAIGKAQEVESKIGELVHRRRELQLKLKSTLELFSRLVESDMEEEPRASIHALRADRGNTG